ncbi:hypothetical protein SORBI_3002G413600 [Sorghum bicolor]|uniref:Ubiquitin-like protease family profile domain-containing protein n=1 Tax=Sorghum bicolor TaxID=4558 RepID=A0A1W0W7S7_SORBI|nr:hypothetical protein SORBI_3002G413600 [Sorghum bicolor]
MNSAAANSCRKRRFADAHEGGSSPRRRRLTLVPNLFQVVRSFAIRTLATAPHKRRHDDATSSSRLCRRRSRHRHLSPVPFPALRPRSPRVALVTTPRRHRKLHVDDARHALFTPCRHRSRSSLLPRVRHFPVLGPFALHFLLKTGTLAPRRRRKPAEVDMGNLFSQLLGKSSSDGVSEAHTKRLDGSPEVVDLTVEPELENIDVVGRRIGDWSVPALGSSRSLEKKPMVRKALQWTKKRVGRLQESGIEKLRLAELPGPLDTTPKEDLSELFTPLSDKEEREVNTLLYNRNHSDKVVVIHEPSNIEITNDKLQCLRPRGWLNDEVINLYIELLKEREQREHNRFLKCHFFNTFFYKKLTCGIAGYDYQSVRRWTMFKRLGYELVECEKIFVPVHRNVHWCLVVINMKDKTLQYLDSLGGLGHDVLKVLVGLWHVYA